MVRTQADAEITHHTTEPPTQKGLDHIAATKPQTEVSCDADTGTTRHATEQSHPDELDPLPLTGLQASASEDGFLPGDKDLKKILALLLWMAQAPLLCRAVHLHCVQVLPD